MLAVVKTPLIDIHIKGKIPGRLVTMLKKEYGRKVRLTKEGEDELLDVFQTDWYKRIKKTLTPGTNLKIYRNYSALWELGRIEGAPANAAEMASRTFIPRFRTVER